VGTELLTRYLEHTDRRTYALVRAENEAAARRRLRERIGLLFGDEDRFDDRLTAVPGDVEAPGLGLADGVGEELAGQVSEIVHCAASVVFELPLEDARRINVEGTRHMLDFAKLCSERDRLDSFSYISTAYVAGTHRGEFGEDELDVGQGFRNSYERSKFEAEALVRRHADRLPIQIFRPSIVVGETETGWTDSFNVLYTPLRAFSRGHLPFVPARLRSPVDVVPVDYVADAVFELSGRRVEGLATYNLVAGEEATSVEELVGLASRELGRSLPRVVPPPIYQRLLHPLLLWRSKGGRRRALERLEAFFPYFSMRVRYRDEHARRMLEPKGIRVKPIRSYFGRLIDFAERAGWGRRAVGRPQASVRISPPPPG